MICRHSDYLNTITRRRLIAGGLALTLACVACSNDNVSASISGQESGGIENTAFILLAVDELTNPAVVEETARLQLDERLTIELATQPGTGYAWSVEELPEIVTVLTEPYVTEPTDNSTVGAAQSFVIELTAAVKGEGRLVLSYRRPWEAEANPAKQVIITIIVE